ncbi:exopolysaccharide biosynthesis protein [Hoeflea sp. BAL378]|uniref:exopolysaccharide biosynthesis protein n=1 Tax=Hoeflea sp. BAL378 TaxID=1547437 RepID=UPI00068F7FBF|nr:exopolysaccharide biosynthesis protein [Hoeflea sp. BAL378]
MNAPKPDPETEERQTRALSHVLDVLEASAEGDSIRVEDVIARLGRQSFASLMLVFSLISTSPASAIPGITATVAAIVFILVVQMIIGRTSVWLPGFITRRPMSTAKLSKGIAWLRKPVHVVERYLKPRLTFLFHRPWRWLPLVLLLGLTVVMPFMEFIPTSGSIASAVIALFAAGYLTRDGGLVLVSLVLLLAAPLAFLYLGPGL